jgi:hypothetical protein
MIPNARRIVAAAALLCFASAPASHAQTDTTSPQVTGIPDHDRSQLPGGMMGELLSVYVPRKEEEIQRLLDEARVLQSMAETELKNSQELSTEAAGRIRIMTEEIAVTKAKRDAAKSAKDKVALAELDAAQKRQEREFKYLNKLSDALHADADRLQSAQAAAGAQAKALEIELQVARQQAALGATPASGAVAEYRTQLRRMLEAQRDAATQAGQASEKRKRLVEERLKQLNELAKLSQ